MKASPPPTASARTRRNASGWCSSKSNAHANVVAVVSCPASTRVIRSSRISLSDNCSPDSPRALTSNDRTSCRSPRRGSARRCAMSAMTTSSISVLARARAGQTRSAPNRRSA
ncbi:Uncharacterised protein [Mycobacterium tuberculosis]|nr:Uncharacterised protein [Mycobacterium tuberculosis]